jgi:citrate lyase subunit beta/citryl-CoA lyase
VRVNGTDTPHYYKDLIAVVEQAGDRLDAIMLPKVRTPGDVEMTDKLLTQIELAQGSSSAGSASRRRSRTRPG